MRKKEYSRLSVHSQPCGVVFDQWLEAVLGNISFPHFTSIRFFFLHLYHTDITHCWLYHRHSHALPILGAELTFCLLLHADQY